MFPTQKEMDITIDCLIKKIWELTMTLKTFENKSKALDEALENFNKERDKNKELEERVFNLEMENGKLKTENKRLEEKAKVKDEVKDVIKKLISEGEKKL